MDTYETERIEELRREEQQLRLSEHVIEVLANVIIHQLGMINHWGRGRPGESILRDVQRRCDELSGWVEGQD